MRIGRAVQFRCQVVPPVLNLPGETVSHVVFMHGGVQPTLVSRDLGGFLQEFLARSFECCRRSRRIHLDDDRSMQVLDGGGERVLLLLERGVFSSCPTFLRLPMVFVSVYHNDFDATPPYSWDAGEGHVEDGGDRAGKPSATVAT